MTKKRKKAAEDTQTAKMAGVLRDFLTSGSKMEKVLLEECDQNGHGRMQGTQKVPIQDTGQEGSCAGPP